VCGSTCPHNTSAHPHKCASTRATAALALCRGAEAERLEVALEEALEDLANEKGASAQLRQRLSDVRVRPRLCVCNYATGAWLGAKEQGAGAQHWQRLRTLGALAPVLAGMCVRACACA